MEPNAQAVHASTNFLFEMGILAKTPRSAFPFLGSGSQSVAEHTNRACYMGLVLAQLEGGINTSKVILMCLLHDIIETRCSDLNYVHQQYVQADEDKIINEMLLGLPFAGMLKEALLEFRLRKTPEALLAKDADNLEWIMTLKEQFELGNKRAMVMIKNAQKRLKSESAQALCDQIILTPADEWYTSTKDNSWWIERSGSHHV